MHLISLMPDPAAYGANDLTRNAHVKAKRPCRDESASQSQAVRVNDTRPLLAPSRAAGRDDEDGSDLRTDWTYRERDIDEPLDACPTRPGDPVLAQALLDLPAAELAVEPPPLPAVPELEVRQPGRHDRHEGRVEADDGACDGEREGGGERKGGSVGVTGRPAAAVTEEHEGGTRTHRRD